MKNIIHKTIYYIFNFLPHYFLRHVLTVFLLPALIIFMLCGCNAWQYNDMLHVCVSIYPVYDFTVKIGGDNVEVVNLTPGGNVHGFELSGYDMFQISASDVFIYNGAGLEPWAEDAVTSLDGMDIIIKKAAEGIELIDAHQHTHDGHAHNFDPHVWLYPINAKIMAQNILNALCEADAPNSSYYTQNYNTLANGLDTLDSEYKEALSDKQIDTIAVSHNAFGYMCNAYGLHQLSVTDVNDNNEISLADYNSLIAEIRQRGIRVIFYDEKDGAAVAAPLAEECGAEVMPLSAAAALTNNQKQNGDDYFSVMRQNLEALKYALC